jgi:hypothetical protein
LHAARLIEEPLQHQGPLRGDDAQNPLGRLEVLYHLAGRVLGQAHFGNEPRDRARRIAQAFVHVLAQP